MKPLYRVKFEQEATERTEKNNMLNDSPYLFALLFKLLKWILTVLLKRELVLQAQSGSVKPSQTDLKNGQMPGFIYQHA
jgi:hypothetical protein